MLALRQNAGWGTPSEMLPPYPDKTSVAMLSDSREHTFNLMPLRLLDVLFVEHKRIDPCHRVEGHFDINSAYISRIFDEMLD